LRPRSREQAIAFFLDYAIALAAKLFELRSVENGVTTASVAENAEFMELARRLGNAIVISALIAAAPWRAPQERAYAESLADDWNERLESWCYVKDSALCTLSSLCTVVTRTVSCAMATALSVASRLLTVPDIRTTPSRSVST
jgi:cytosine/adenosine deaminase-related metal-dependent hydrolase